MISVNGSTIRINQGDSGVLDFKFDSAMAAGKTLVLNIGKKLGEAPLITKSITTTAGRTQSIALSSTDTNHEAASYYWDLRYVDSPNAGVVTIAGPSQFIILPVVREVE